jgi:hypothetical protein
MSEMKPSGGQNPTVEGDLVATGHSAKWHEMGLGERWLAKRVKARTERREGPSRKERKAYEEAKGDRARASKAYDSQESKLAIEAEAERAARPDLAQGYADDDSLLMDAAASPSPAGSPAGYTTYDRWYSQHFR